ncbi:MAG: hypothetical protein WC590_13805 [Burkholderiaceae bacterium]
MSNQIPPPFPVPGTDDGDQPVQPDTPVPEEDPALEEEDYKLPPMEPPAPIREPRIPGA